MKKIGIILCTAALAVQAAAISASAEEASAKVYVTIGNAGKTVVAAEAVTVKDLDSDGKLTIDEALYAAHEQFYNGGAAAGYANETTQYGLSLKTLWGVTNGGGYGYYVNDGFAMSLSDPVKEGDYLNAFVYQDLDKWSDRYAYFDVRTLPDAKQGDTVTLKLSEMVFGADGAPVPGPVANAVITVDGEETAYKTDSDGKVDLKLEKAGSVQISAKANVDDRLPLLRGIALPARHDDYPAELRPVRDGAEAEPPFGIGKRRKPVEGHSVHVLALRGVEAAVLLPLYRVEHLLHEIVYEKELELHLGIVHRDGKRVRDIVAESADRGIVVGAYPFARKVREAVDERADALLFPVAEEGFLRRLFGEAVFAPAEAAGKARLSGGGEHDGRPVPVLAKRGKKLLRRAEIARHVIRGVLRAVDAGEAEREGTLRSEPVELLLRAADIVLEYLPYQNAGARPVFAVADALQGFDEIPSRKALGACDEYFHAFHQAFSLSVT